MATQARSGSPQPSPPRSAGPRSESDFVRTLSAHALSAVALADVGSVRGLTTTELEDASGLSRPSITTLISRFAPVLEGQDANGELVPDLEQAGRWTLDAGRWTLDAGNGVVVAVVLGPAQLATVALSDLYGRLRQCG